VLLLRNKDQKYNNRLASFATCLCKWANWALALSLSGASRSRLCPDGPRVHLYGPAYMPICTRPEVRFPLDQRTIFCVAIVVKKRKLLCLAQVVFSYFVLHSNKIPLVRPKLHIWADSQIE